MALTSHHFDILSHLAFMTCTAEGIS